jgi:branched-subunit amino acid aminotransferase/4-amino-4-deoxychorismate lyase
MSTTYSLNGTLTTTKPTITLADFGFARGITVFELFRVYHGHPFRMEAHLNRLESGAAQLGIPLPLTRSQIEQQVHALISTHNHPHSAVKFYLTAGECSSASGLSFAACSGFSPQLIILEDAVKPQNPVAPYGMEAYQRGQRLMVVHHIRELPTVKTANYGIGFVAARQVAGPDYDDVLFTTPQGFITEATRSNFFAVINGTLTTAKSGMLDGITRNVLLDLAHQLNIPTAVRDFTTEDLLTATEAFTTGSIAEMVPVRSINGTTLPGAENRMMTPTFAKLREAFTTLIQTECA